MTVELESLCWLIRQLSEDVSGASWSEMFVPFGQLEQVTRDGGTGLAKGVALLNQSRQEQGLAPVIDQGDHYHGLRGGGLGLWRAKQRAEQALAKAETADKVWEQSRRRGQKQTGPAIRARLAWRKAEQAMDRWCQTEQDWERTTQAMRLFTPDGPSEHPGASQRGTDGNPGAVTRGGFCQDQTPVAQAGDAQLLGPSADQVGGVAVSRRGQTSGRSPGGFAPPAGVVARGKPGSVRTAWGVVDVCGGVERIRSSGDANADKACSASFGSIDSFRVVLIRSRTLAKRCSAWLIRSCKSTSLVIAELVSMTMIILGYQKGPHSSWQIGIGPCRFYHLSVSFDICNG